MRSSLPSRHGSALRREGSLVRRGCHLPRHRRLDDRPPRRSARGAGGGCDRFDAARVARALRAVNGPHRSIDTDLAGPNAARFPRRHLEGSGRLNDTPNRPASERARTRAWHRCGAIAIVALIETSLGAMNSFAICTASPRVLAETERIPQPAARPGTIVVEEECTDTAPPKRERVTGIASRRSTERSVTSTTLSSTTSIGPCVISW